MKSIVLTCIISFWLMSSFSQSTVQKTYCNPMDIDYKYNFEQMNEHISYRSGADPVIVNHKGEYYLFVTIQGGWWHSKDLVHWQFVKPDKWPMEDMCAPAALSVRDTLFLFQSTFDQRPIFYTTTPENGHLEFYNRWLPLMPGAKGPWDPDIFHDPDTDKWYMYFESSNIYPMYGIELNHKEHLKYIDSAKALFELHPQEHGWERFGQDHRGTIDPYMEGAWMTKHNGKYFLQYAAPGTEYNVYANGTYIADHPLGPFTYAPYNPISYKPGGFMQGAGHGNTFQDNYGNWWNTGTPWVAVNWNFERRIAMFPAGFDKDNQLYADTRFGDFPHYLPKGKWNKSDELFAGWMLLSYHKPAKASSVRDTFAANRVTDENPRTFWVAQQNKAGETLTIDLLHPCTVNAIQINYTDHKSNIYNSDSTVYTQFKLYASADQKNWQLIADLTHEKRDRPNAYLELARPVTAHYIKYEHVYTAAPNLAISDVRVFGNAHQPLPQTPGKLEVKRDSDTRNAFIRWKKVNSIVGYNIRWGISPGKLYQTYQIFADQPSYLELRALNKGQKYYFAIEAFNESGVSKLSKVVATE